MTTPYDDAVRERFNALAVKVAKLEQENAALRANQLPAGAVCPTGETRVAMPGEWFLWYDGCIIERKGRDNTGQSYPIYRRVEAHGADDHFVDANKLVAERDALRQEVERLRANRDYHQRRSNMFGAEVAQLATEHLEYERQLRDLRRCREAWDAVRKLGLDVNRDWCKPQWKAIASDGSQGSRYHADPIEAVLELAKTLEAGK